MTNYNEQTLTGTSWTRCRAVTITNPISGTPEAFFQEEKAIDSGGSVSTLDIGACSKAFDPTATIPLLDPATGLATGATVTQGELYVILFSLYMQTALERDAA